MSNELYWAGMAAKHLAEADRLRAQNARLMEALQYAQGGFALAYEDAARGHTDSILLICGAHEAAAVKALASAKEGR